MSLTNGKLGSDENLATSFPSDALDHTESMHAQILGDWPLIVGLSCWLQDAIWL